MQPRATRGVAGYMPNIPEDNRVAEIKNQSPLTTIRCLLFGYPMISAEKHFTQLLICIQKVQIKPVWVIEGDKPNVLHLKIFGCKAYAYIPKVGGGGVNYKSQLEIMLRYQRLQDFRLLKLEK